MSPDRQNFKMFFFSLFLNGFVLFVSLDLPAKIKSIDELIVENVCLQMEIRCSCEVICICLWFNKCVKGPETRC